MDDELIDDVFEDESQFNPKLFYQNTNTGLNINEAAFFDDVSPSPTSKHPAFRAIGTKSSQDSAADFDDGWKSFKIEDDTEFDENILHKVILLGDSGVGKTSFIVKYHTNEFKTASFSATVGIALTKFRTQVRQNTHASQAQAQNTVTYSSFANKSQLNSNAESAIDKNGVCSETSIANIGHNKQLVSNVSKQRQQKESSNKPRKVLLLGDSGVGKTCLLLRFQEGDSLSGSFVSTVGVDFLTKSVQLDNAQVKLQIWDTAGQERFRSVTHAYYRDAQALLLLYDVTNMTSFDNIRAWLVEIREYAAHDVVILLLGNKADCSDRQVNREDGERLAREYNVIFMETSAKSGLNVDTAFLAVARNLKNRNTDSVDDARFNVQNHVNEHSSKGSTCPSCNF